ncbi:MAG TPA: aldo/keto reductase, partial [Anaeromyxobacter sp.]
MSALGRRRFLALSAAAGIGAAVRARAQGGKPMLTRRIPRSGEALPVIGLGTWQTFDVGPTPEERAPRREVLRAFLGAGGRVIDSSPMYGRAEEVTGDLLAELPGAPAPFLATKVWTRGKAAGEAQIGESFRRLRAPVIDLLQVHNLLDWETHLPALRDLRAAGKIRHLGITHYATSAFGEMERL